MSSSAALPAERGGISLPEIPPPADQKNPPARDHAIEGLRGFAALVVFYHHLMQQQVGGWSPAPAWTWFVSGPAAVLVFFVLSGYVIGVAYRTRPDANAVKRYSLRRAIRLIPINCAGVLLACAVADALNLPTVVGNLLFLENFADYAGHWVMVLPQNYNLWSLNYEVLFYALFVLLWWPRLPLRWAVVACLTIGALGWFGLGLPVFAACYAFGFLFWLAGLALAWRSTETPAARSNWLSCLLLAVVTWKLQPTAEVMLAFDPSPPRFAGPVVKLYHLDFLPVCVWLVADVARRSFPGLGLVRWLAVAIPLAGFAWRFMRGYSLAEAEIQALGGAYVVALLLWRWRLPTEWWARLAPLGAISYALYATARPIEIAVFRAGQALPANSLGFGVCAAVTIIVAFVVAWYLERRLQPAISAGCNRMFFGKPPVVTPAAAAACKPRLA